MAEELYVERKGDIATVTFNRPDQRNVIDYDGWLELGRIARELANDAATKVVVLTGRGDESFSAGADIKDFDKHRNDSTAAKEYADAFDGAMDAVEAIPKPTISLVKGFCVGGGCELSTATDVRIAAENSRFGIPVARLGILVGYREMRRLLDLVGPGHASYLLLSARTIDALEALRIGLVSSVVSLDRVEEHTYELAREMAAMAPLSHSRHKRIRQTVLRNPRLEGLTPDEEHLPFANFDSEDFQEGRRAFLEHEAPRFKGR